MNVLQYSPGSVATVILQTLGEDGYRVDGYYAPFVSRLILPDFSESSLYPLNMIRIDTGLYYHKFQIPAGASAVGTYIVDITYYSATGDPKETLTQVICQASSGGSFSISPN